MGTTEVPVDIKANLGRPYIRKLPGYANKPGNPLSREVQGSRPSSGHTGQLNAALKLNPEKPLLPV